MFFLTVNRSCVNRIRTTSANFHSLRDNATANLLSKSLIREVIEYIFRERVLSKPTERECETWPNQLSGSPPSCGVWPPIDRDSSSSSCQFCSVRFSCPESRGNRAMTRTTRTRALPSSPSASSPWPASGSSKSCPFRWRPFCPTFSSRPWAWWVQVPSPPSTWATRTYSSLAGLWWPLQLKRQVCTRSVFCLNVPNFKT